MRNSWALMLITCVVCCIFLTACETQSTTDSQQMGTESAPQSESAEISEEDEQQIQKEEQESETEEALLSEDKEEAVPGISQSSQTSDMLKIEIGQETFTATLANNSSVDALKELLKNGPLTLKMSCLLYTSPSPRDLSTSRMPSSA